jgi:DNA modification methylase
MENLPINQIICGDALEVLKKMPSDFVDCIITSPPYWSTRVYLPEDHPNKLKEIGLEDHPQEYINKIVEICLECVRVLKKSGVFFLNLGDVFYTSSHQGGYDRLNKEFNKIYNHRLNVRGKYKSNWLQQKGRLLLPMRIAITLQEKGITIRDVIIWVKKITKYPEKTSIGTTMPFPVRDRLLPAFEYIFQIVKSHKYYFDLEPIKTELKMSSLIRFEKPIVESYPEDNPRKKSMAGVEKFRKKFSAAKQGTDWNVQLKKEISKANPTNVVMFKAENQFTTSRKHYAKFPTSLVEFFVLAGCPKSGIVLDPFCGSGTTCVVAKKLGRNYIGIDISPEFCKIAEQRLNNTMGSLF